MSVVMVPSSPLRVASRFAALVLAASLAACGGGGVDVAQPTAPATPPANRAPTISGSGAATIVVAQPYNFAPVASDPDGNALTFSITGKPAWATFSTATGALGGTPGSGDVGTSNVTITVSDGSLSASLSFAITVNVTTPTNRAPTISGAGTVTVVPGQALSYTPTASDPDGNAIAFTIANKPAWMNFSTTTGALSGTPAAADAGTYAVTITVSDGTLTASLPVSVTVTAAVTGSATISWTPPTTRTDGSALTNLASYRIYYGTTPSSLSATANVTNSSLTTFVVSNLAAGTWYFAMSAIDAAGVESSRTNSVSIVIR